MTAYSRNRYDGRVFAAENFLSWQTLVTLAGIKRQFLELLASIGFVPVEIGPRRGGYDNILSVTGPEVSNNWPSFNAILTAWTFVQFQCIVFMIFTEQIQYILSIHTHILSHTIQKIVINPLVLKVDFSWHSVWCWETRISPKLLAKNMQNKGWPYKSFADYTGHLILVPKCYICYWGLHEMLLGSRNLRFIFVQYSHDFTWICQFSENVAHYTNTCDILLLSFISFNMKKFIWCAFHEIQREANLR